jgi:glucose-6-phosphate 1-dehydrogenase
MAKGAKKLKKETHTDLDPADLVIFGGTGDLSLRKIIPALYYRLQAEQLPDTSRIVLIGRGEMDDGALKAMITKACNEFVEKSDFNDADFKRLADRSHYCRIDAGNSSDYKNLKLIIDNEPRPVRVFYLATPADIFGVISEQLKLADLITPDARVVLEKPLGRDLESFNMINQSVLACFEERQIYRIDHYLGKETVQNLMVLRFGNALFGRVWNKDAIDHVQITVAESIGVGERYSYYNNYGAMRDMIQNHLLQLVCLLTMEPPPNLQADTVRDEKLKVLRSIRPITIQNVNDHCVRGQYRGGMVGSKQVGSYIDDIDGQESDTETYVALKLHLDNWRWSNVPFYLRTGKRMQQRYSEIVIQFRNVPLNIFPHQAAFPETNKLIIRLQPDEYIRLQMNTKVPGPGGYRLKPVNLNLSLAEQFDERYPEAYERLLMDVVRGNPILFMRTDEVEAAWLWAEQLLEAWEQSGQRCQPYAAGSWGPEAASALIARDGRYWYHDEDE